MVAERSKNDYGKDFHVQLVEHGEGATQRVTGKEFSVQAKGSDGEPEVSAAVRVSTLNSWLNSIEPVLLIKFFNRNLLRPISVCLDRRRIEASSQPESPRWREQATVSIPLSLELKRTIRFRNRGTLSDGGQDDASSRGTRASFRVERSPRPGSELSVLSTSAGLEGPLAAIRTAAKHLERLAYSVAVLGNSRVGKSTLLNRLLGAKSAPCSNFQPPRS